MPDLVQKITAIVQDTPIDLDALEAAFDEASPENRVTAIRRFTPAIQEELYTKAEGCRLSIDDVVPPGVEPLVEVIHEGQNTLPAFRAFQKRFCRPDPARAPEDREVLWGYNEQTFQLLTGPGYFVAYDDESTGEVCIDYREIPPNAPDGWPDVVPNERRLGRFVYAGTVDRLRRISEHVSIGRAFEGDDEPMDAWFALVRRPV